MNGNDPSSGDADRTIEWPDTSPSDPAVRPAARSPSEEISRLASACPPDGRDAFENCERRSENVARGG